MGCHADRDGGAGRAAADVLPAAASALRDRRLQDPPCRCWPGNRAHGGFQCATAHVPLNLPRPARTSIAAITTERPAPGSPGNAPDRPRCQPDRDRSSAPAQTDPSGRLGGLAIPPPGTCRSAVTRASCLTRLVTES